MLSKLEKEKNYKGYFGIIANMYIREDGNFLAWSTGKDGYLSNFISENINKMNDDALYEIIIKLLNDSLNRELFMPIDEKRKNIDEIYKWETKDYKKDKCKSVKRIAFHITNVFPGFLHIVDEQCLGNHYWGGGKYTHLLPINSDKETIIKKVRDIYEYKEGHLPGTSEEEKKKYRVIQKCN